MLNVHHAINRILEFYHQALNKRDKLPYLPDFQNVVERLHTQLQTRFLLYQWQFVPLHQLPHNHHNTVSPDSLQRICLLTQSRQLP